MTKTLKVAELPDFDMAEMLKTEEDVANYLTLVLEENAPVTLYLTVKPLSPLRASVTQTSYQVTLSPDNISSYRLRATLDSGQNSADARIGLHGTAKISGDWVTLIYYLLRRPVAAAREWSGL